MWLDFSVHPLFFNSDGTNEEVIAVCESLTDKLNAVRISTDYLGETKNITLHDWSRERFNKLLNGVI